MKSSPVSSNSLRITFQIIPAGAVHVTAIFYVTPRFLANFTNVSEVNNASVVRKQTFFTEITGRQLLKRSVMQYQLCQSHDTLSARSFRFILSCLCKLILQLYLPDVE
jgi:hypothetical protein